jgi:aryl-alcohol dehydrogenase-like predicted oxidoreductase
MKERGNRDEMVIATKFTSNYVGHKKGKGLGSVNSSGNHKRSLHVSLRDSLKKLDTEWVDILYLHWWDWTTSVEEVMDSLDAVVKQGKVLYLGISDTPAYIVSAANTYARATGKTQFSIYQGRWNVILRDLEREIIPMCRHFGMAIAPWDSIGGGKWLMSCIGCTIRDTQLTRTSQADSRPSSRWKRRRRTTRASAPSWPAPSRPRTRRRSPPHSTMSRRLTASSRRPQSLSRM